MVWFGLVLFYRLDDLRYPFILAADAVLITSMAIDARQCCSRANLVAEKVIIGRLECIYIHIIIIIIIIFIILREGIWNKGEVG